MNAINRVSGHGPRVAHVLAAITGAIQSIAEAIARRMWLMEYQRAERAYWGPR